MNPFGGPERRPVAEAQPGAEQPEPNQPPEKARMSRFDVNGDGVVDKAELEATLKADFKKDDTNGNDVLDPLEARELNERLRADSGTSPVFDWNGDGRLVYSEFATQWRTLFDRTDRNGDGIIDADEMKYSGRERKARPLPQPSFSGKDGRPPGSN